MENVGCPALFGPRCCRHIFVNSGKNYLGMACPHDEGAVLAMGSSVRMWDRSYDQVLVSRETWAVVNNIEAWRDVVTSMHVADSQSVPPQPLTSCGPSSSSHASRKVTGSSMGEEEGSFQSCASE